MSKRKKWSSAMKFEIALQTLKNDMPLNEICNKYEIAPGQVHAWKKQLLEQGAQVFNKADKTVKLLAEHEETTRVLYEKVGQLTVERDYLKKCWSKLHGSSDNN